MTLKSIIKISLTIIFIIVLICDLWITAISFFDAIWIEIFGFGDGPGNLKIMSVFTWMDALGISMIIILSTGLGFLTYRSWVPKRKIIDLKTIRTPITIISGLVFIYDLFFIYNVLFHMSWPTAGKIEETGVDYPIMSFLVGEILILLILITFQIGLGRLTYRAWVSKSQDINKLMEPSYSSNPTPEV